MSRNRNTVAKKYSKFLNKDKDWDWEYMLELEKFKLERMSKYFSESKLTIDWERMVREINLCIKLINIVIDQDFIGYLNNENKKLPYINTRNYKRFVNYFYERESSYDNLRQTKALHLYNLIRTYRMRSWWD